MRELSQTGVADDDRAYNLTWHDWINLKSLIAVSRVIAAAALAREDSRGAHFREDFPDTGDLPRSTYTVVRQTATRSRSRTNRCVSPGFSPARRYRRNSMPLDSLKIPCLYR